MSWKVKLSPAVCLSTQEAEYYALSEGTKEALNLRIVVMCLFYDALTMSNCSDVLILRCVDDVRCDAMSDVRCDEVSDAMR